ncbi:MAG: stage V sporulation protein AD, partial [Clostridia bacterium]|nr:stage V sporulation protein AD [Clostridia bacterium]
LGDLFDFCDPSDLFGMNTWERAEGEMSRIALNIALKKSGISPDKLSVLSAGDLQNQCVASSGGLFSFGIPFLGLYGACSTCTEALIVACSLMSLDENYNFGAAVTSSHNCAAERQFRTPIEYGGQRAPTAQWTATASGAFILSREESPIKISAIMPGKIIDGYTSDATNMGAAMALSASETILNYFEKTKEDVEEYDLILTGDLGSVGSSILAEVLKEKSKFGKKLAEKHKDCGCLLYGDGQDFHAGGSGCGCSASVLASHFLPKVRAGEIRKMLLLSTGALMSTSSVFQGEHIMGITPLIKIEHNKI